MQWLTSLFVVAVIAEMITRLWLSSRQIAAVRAHRDAVPELFRNQVELADQQKAADYTVARAQLGRIDTVFDAFLRLVFTLGGGIAAIDVLWQKAGLAQPWHGALVIGTVMLVLALLNLPFSLWRTFRLEARFGFNRVSPALFVTDLAKGLVLSVVLGGPVVIGALLLMDRGGPWWWLYAWAAWTVFSLALTWAFPRFIAPLFNRFTPLTDEALKQRVETLLARTGFTSKGVFVMDGSRRSAHGNAYFTGVGRNKRIVFFDTLLERLGGAEVEAVLAHELGHFRLKHVRQRIVLSLVMSFVALALLAWAAKQPEIFSALGVPLPSSHTLLLLAMFVVPPFTYFLTPLGAWWSRRHEFQADDFAAKNASAAALAEALVKLYRANASTLTPDPLHSAFYDSHPPALVRIARLQNAAS
ncbi:MAG TPA: M48 family metallopeptidase [Steroidobacteraceae bacterium]|jgi:STE24 endopeptidase|nr:M48 family metallopeptidase [Steroidobacteraceae bacterium]